MSASFSASAPLPSCSARRTRPSVADSCTSCPSMLNGTWNSASIMAGFTCAASPSTQKMSPPMRATVSCWPRLVCRRSATASSSITVTAVSDAPSRSGGTVANLSVLENSGTTTLGLGSLAYGNGGGADEAGQTLTITVTAVPAATLGDIVLANGTTVVTAGTAYTLNQLQGMQFRAAANATGGPQTFSWSVQDSGGTGNGGQDTLGESLQITIGTTNQAPVLAGAANPEGARALVDFMTGPEVQAALPDSMYVFPVVDDTPLPEDWATFAQQPTDPWEVDPAEVAANRDDWLTQWRDVTTG
eukprot:gene23009-26060_t